MSRLSRVATALGAAAAVVGLAIAGGAAVPGLSFGYLFVTLVGALALLQGARYADDRRHTPVRTAETGDPEVRQRLPTPGDEFDADAFPDTGGVRYNTRRRLRERLRDAAVETLVVRGECPPDAAKERVAAGTWTDDPVAADFLGDDASRLALRRRVGLWVRRESAFAYRVCRAVDAVTALHGASGAGGPGAETDSAATGADANRKPDPDPDPNSNSNSDAPAAREGSP